MEVWNYCIVFIQSVKGGPSRTGTILKELYMLKQRWNSWSSMQNSTRRVWTYLEKLLSSSHSVSERWSDRKYCKGTLCVGVPCRTLRATPRTSICHVMRFFITKVLPGVNIRLMMSGENICKCCSGLPAGIYLIAVNVLFVEWLPGYPVSGITPPSFLGRGPFLGISG